MTDERYYVVEARLPVQVTEAASVDEAARIAARRIEREYGVDIANWFLRVFVYGGGDEVGPKEEWFSSPGGKFRRIDQNVEAHEQRIKETENDE